MKFVNWLLEQGYERKAINHKTGTWITAKNFSSVVPNACMHYLTKGNSVFGVGLGQVGFPPHLLFPKLPNLPIPQTPISFEVVSSEMVDKMDCKEAFDILYPLSISEEWVKQFKN